MENARENDTHILKTVVSDFGGSKSYWFNVCLLHRSICLMYRKVLLGIGKTYLIADAFVRTCICLMYRMSEKIPTEGKKPW